MQVGSKTQRLRGDWRSLRDERFTLRDDTGNWADYDLCKPYVCCGWMDLHDDIDYGVTPEQPYFWIQPLYWDRRAVFVVTDESGRLVSVPRSGEVIRFDGTKLHGLLPPAVAREVLERQDEEGPHYKAFSDRLPRNMPPKMVWRWLEDPAAGAGIVA